MSPATPGHTPPEPSNREADSPPADKVSGSVWPATRKEAPKKNQEILPPLSRFSLKPVLFT